MWDYLSIALIIVVHLIILGGLRYWFYRMDLRNQKNIKKGKLKKARPKYNED